MRLATLALLFITVLAPLAFAADRAARVRANRVISGQVYFTNNSPERSDYPIELWTGDQRRRLRRTRANRHGGFELRGLRPAVYIFHIHGPRDCLLRYRVDTRRLKVFDMTILMDAACWGGDGAAGIRDAKPNDIQ